MPVIHFDLVCPEIAAKGSRGIRMVNDPEIPDGDYYFVEMFCDNPKCDCKEAILEVYEKSISTPLATILYRWGTTAVVKNRPDVCSVCRSGVELVSDGDQSAIAHPLLHLFAECLEERSFDQTILQHYKLFKAALTGKRNVIRSKGKFVNRRKAW